MTDQGMLGNWRNPLVEEQPINGASITPAPLRSSGELRLMRFVCDDYLWHFGAGKRSVHHSNCYRGTSSHRGFRGCSSRSTVCENSHALGAREGERWR